MDWILKIRGKEFYIAEPFEVVSQKKEARRFHTAEAARVEADSVTHFLIHHQECPAVAIDVVSCYENE